MRRAGPALLAALLLLGLIGLPMPGALAQTAQCSDGVDNDGDVAVDYPEDPGCATADDNTEDGSHYSSRPQCNDNVDNDYDNAEDMNDSECESPADNIEGPETPACSDGIDNDEDGAIDHPDDSGCSTAGDFREDRIEAECADGLDNDGDGNIDYPNDTACARLDDDFECTDCPDTGQPECGDGIDNDGDGLIDWGDDPDCERYGDEEDGAIHEDVIHDRTVNIGRFRHVEFPRYTGLMVKGLVRAEESRCAVRVPVKIQIRDDGRWITWKTDTTNSEGRFKVIVRDLPERFRASASWHRFEPDPDSQQHCRPAQDIRRHRHHRR